MLIRVEAVADNKMNIVYVILCEYVDHSTCNDGPYAKVILITENKAEAEKVLMDEVEKILGDIAEFDIEKRNKILKHKYYEDGKGIYFHWDKFGLIYKEFEIIEYAVWIEEHMLKYN